MTDRKNDVAVIGMGVMGANLARNFASRGLNVGADGHHRGADVLDRGERRIGGGRRPGAVPGQSSPSSRGVVTPTRWCRAALR